MMDAGVLMFIVSIFHPICHIFLNFNSILGWQPAFIKNLFQTVYSLLHFLVSGKLRMENEKEGDELLENKKPNRLIGEKSPYLLQHAYNPVDWYPWGKEAFTKAKRENKPVFVSIGYSTCHWCHVMKRECFEDEEVAKKLNESFVSIKVDREERPDIDSIYMNVCQMLIGHGGWPLNVFLTPDQKPFYAGTYFPKYSRYGHPGFLDVLARLQQLYQQKQGELASYAEKITEALKQKSQTESGTGPVLEVAHDAYRQLEASFDDEFGGFGQAPKFPMPHQFMFLMRYASLQGEEKALHMTEKSMKAMISGGIWDHIGGGFARYSTDREWLVPHFEKMLYDQALMLYVLAEMYMITKEDQWKETALTLTAFLRREMLDETGVFYSAIDADSEGEEGKYYIWGKEDIFMLLGHEAAEIFCKAYNITEAGNFEEKNIPNLIGTNFQNIAASFGRSVRELKHLLSESREVLRRARGKRVYPHLDDKILTAWNALMIASLAKASRAFQEPEMLDMAQKALAFIESRLWVDGKLHVRYRDGDVRYPAYLDDYAYLLWAYLELYDAVQDPRHLNRAMDFCEIMFDSFWDHENGGFFFTGKSSEALLLRQKQAFDDALPSGNSVAAVMLWRLSKYTGEMSYAEKAKTILACFQEDIEQYPGSFLFMLQSLMGIAAGGREIVITGSSEQDRARFKKSFIRRFLPFDCLIEADPLDPRPFWADKTEKEKPFVLFLCEHFACQQPVYDLQDALEALEKMD